MALSPIHRSVPLALALLFGCLVLATSAAGAVRPAGDTSPYGNELLSNETTLTRVASATLPTPIRTRPLPGASVITKLRYATEDNYPEVYLVQRSALDAKGKVWFKIRIPMRPNGRTGWVPEHSLGELRIVRTQLRVVTGTRATLYKNGRKIWSAPVGTGGAGRLATPTGYFYIREKFKVRNPYGPYGPYAFGTSAYSALSDWPGGGVVGIHGTNQPGLIPGRPSHGCIRVRNAAVRQLFRLMPVGTPVRIT